MANSPSAKKRVRQIARRTAVNTATVKGLAERVVPADTANWTIRYASHLRGVEAPDIEALYASADRQRSRIIEVLDSAGFARSCNNAATTLTR